MKLPIEESEFIPCDVLDIVRYLRQRTPIAAVRFVEAFKSPAKSGTSLECHTWAGCDLIWAHWKRAPGRWKAFASTSSFTKCRRIDFRLLRVLHGARDLQAELEK